MNYYELSKEYWNRTRFKPNRHVDTFLYFYLLNECNIRLWLNPMELQTRDIEQALCMSRKAIAETRNRLRQDGFIEFVGGGGKRPAAYKIIGIDVTNPNLDKLFNVSPEKHLEPNVSPEKHLTPSNVSPKKHLGNIKVTFEKHLGQNPQYKDKDYKTIRHSNTCVGAREGEVCEGSSCPDVVDEFFSKTAAVEGFCMSNRVSVDDLRKMASEIANEWEITDEPDRSTRHLLNVIRIRLNQQRDATTTANSGSRAANPAGFDIAGYAARNIGRDYPTIDLDSPDCPI